MRPWVKRISVLSAMLVAGCATGSLEELRHTSPTGSAYHRALANEYLQLSDAEAQDYDWADSQHFAQKGLHAAYGHTVEPEQVGDWAIPEALQPELMTARDELIFQLTEKNRKNKPQATARALASFDCWLEEQEEGWQLDAIKTCKSRFYAAMETIKTPPKPVAPPKDLIRSTAYMVFFDHNTTAITPEAKDIITKAASDFAQYEDTEILLHGHTDTSGSEQYNMDLSEQRAKAVARALSDAGVKSSRITYFAFGETDLRVPTADNIREPGNRRVEIFLE